MTTDSDVIIIGSGIGGGTLASRSSSHFSLPSHSGSSAGGSGTISLISGTVGLA